MSAFENVIKEFYQKRIEKEMYAEQKRLERMQDLYILAEQADTEMKQKRRQKRRNNKAV